MNMQSIMAQAQKMQKEIMNKKEAINNEEFIGNSELVTVTVNGKKKVLSVVFKNIDSLSNEDLEILQDMVLIALNDAFSKVDDKVEKVMGQYGNSLNGLL